MTGADHLALFIALASAAFALAMAVIMLLLILRRARYEQGAELRQGQELAVSRYLMAAIDGRDEPRPNDVPTDVQCAALAHYLMLVRGDNREQLLAIAERHDLFGEPLAALAHHRPARRIDAIRQLERFASPICIAALEQCLAADRAPAVRLEAAASLARLGCAPAPQALIAALDLAHSPRNRIHAALFRAVAEAHGEDLLRLAGEPANEPILPLLVEALGWTRDLAMVEHLAPFARHCDPEVRAAAVRAARHLGHPGAGNWIAQLVDDPAEMVRVQAAQACGQLGLSAAVPALERHAADPAWWVRTRVRTALDVLRPQRRARFTLVARVP